jgi:FKBP-type peptidyl-prolyl cis-trans isomerase (trigger factor)
MMDKVDAIISLRPGAKWHMREDVLIWEDEEQVQPTEEELTAEIARLQAEYDSQDYARKRQKEYPSLSDQLDEIYHNGIDSWKATIRAVKEKYPKE